MLLVHHISRTLSVHPRVPWGGAITTMPLAVWLSSGALLLEFVLVCQSIFSSYQEKMKLGMERGNFLLNSWNQGFLVPN